MIVITFEKYIANSKGYIDIVDTGSMFTDAYRS